MVTQTGPAVACAIPGVAGVPTRQWRMGARPSKSSTSSMREALLCGVKCGGRLKWAASCRFCSTVKYPSTASSVGDSLTKFLYSLVVAGSLLYCTLPAASNLATSNTCYTSTGIVVLTRCRNSSMLGKQLTVESVMIRLIIRHKLS